MSKAALSENPPGDAPSFSGLAFERRAMAEGYRLRALATNDPILRSAYDGIALAYDCLASDVDRTAETMKRIDVRTKSIATGLVESPSSRTTILTIPAQSKS
jgi:hypothetical protein